MQILEPSNHYVVAVLLYHMTKEYNTSGVTQWLTTNLIKLII